jgi:DNA-binding NarL/FixJ family response regulator
MSKVRLLIADDHEVVRRGVRAILEAEPAFEVCAEASDGREAVEKALELRPDVLVLDIAMPRLNGLEATREILRELRSIEVLILTVHDSEQLVREVLQAGARGYLLKSDAGRLLLAAVESVSQHKPYFTSTVARLVLSGFLDPGAVGAPAQALTPRERQVLQLVAEGDTNKEISAALHIGLKTVESHRTNVMKKLNLHSIAELVRYAVRNGVVDA